MTDEQMRVAIAEACGWRFKQIVVSGLEDVVCFPPGVEDTDENCWHYAGGEFPDYLNDLNACHEMEKVLTETQLNEYVHIIYELTPLALHNFVCVATARHRCEAFIATIGRKEGV